MRCICSTANFGTIAPLSSISYVVIPQTHSKIGQVAYKFSRVL